MAPIPALLGGGIPALGASMTRTLKVKQTKAKCKTAKRKTAER